MGSEEFSSYQLMVQKNIEENRRILRSLGLASETNVTPKKKVSRPSYVRRPRLKNQHPVATNNFQPNRICTRHSSSVLQSVKVDDSPVFPDTNNDEENTPPEKKIKIESSFGDVIGVRVGDWWPTRLNCSAAGVHRPLVAGIHGKQSEGCYSIALSGGYEDDLDCGNFFTYTGCGGRDLKGTKCNPKNLRTAPQSKDQVLEGLNAALASNVENRKPVRVIRGFKLQSPYAPEEGYRYDGLYSVEKYWTATGLSGFKVYKYALKRLADQDLPPWESCAQDIKPLQLKEPPTIEEKLSHAQINEMQTTKSVIFNTDCVKDCSHNLPPKIASRERVRKQSFPRQHQKIDYDSSDNDESVSIFSSEFQEKSEKVNLVKKSLKLTENGPNVMNCLENSIDCTLVKYSNNYVQNVKENNSVQRSNGEILPQLCTTPLTPVQNKNSDLKSHSVVSLSNSSEKRMRISPAVAFNHREYHEVKTVEEESFDYTNLEMSSYLDNKKQATILKYFSPVKNSLENVLPKSAVNPKSLRSNRIANSSFINLGIDSRQKCVPLNKVNSVLNNKSIEPSRENDSIQKASPMKEVKSSSRKRKYASSLIKNKEHFNLHLTKIGPSMMDNLIKQNYDKLKMHNQIKSINTKNNNKLPPVKPCSVVLKRIRVEDRNQTDFIGWDFDCDHIPGFKEIEITKVQVSSNTFQAFIKSWRNVQDSPDKKDIELNGFFGWESNSDAFKGTSGKVMAFIIDKLSKRCVQGYLSD